MTHQKHHLLIGWILTVSYLEQMEISSYQYKIKRNVRIKIVAIGGVNILFLKKPKSHCNDKIRPVQSKFIFDQTIALIYHNTLSTNHTHSPQILSTLTKYYPHTNCPYFNITWSAHRDVMRSHWSIVCTNAPRESSATRGGATQVERGPHPRYVFRGGRGLFLRTSACPRFCKRRVLFCTKVRSMGVKIPLQSTKYTRL